MIEALLLTLVVALATIPLARGRPQGPLLALVACCLALGWGLAVGGERPPPPSNLPAEVRDGGYVSSDTCRACHPSEHASWRRTFHRTMTQRATPEAFAADLDGVEVTLWGQRHRFFRRGDELWVDMPDPTAPESAPHRALIDAAADRAQRIERPIVMITGSHHYQVFWVPRSLDEGARDVINLRIVYLIAEARWIPRSAAFLEPPDLRQGVVPWRLSCIKCHATRGRPGPELDTDVIEFGIGCESCHGPGEAHVAAHQDPLHRYAAHLGGGADETIVNPARLDHERASEVCAQCHSLLSLPDTDDFIANGTPFRPGQPIADVLPHLRGELIPADKRDERIWADGDARVTGSEWVGMSGSRCFTEGELSCLSCHSLHDGTRDDQLAAAATGDRDDACTACHAAATYAADAHTHHAADSSGSRCVNCHMPHTSYGLLKAVRSHRIDSPSVAGSLASRRPIACNLCHLDRTLAWTAETMRAWYGQPMPSLDVERRRVSEALALLLRGDAGQRALIAWSMGWGPAQAASDIRWIAPYLTFTLNDPYDAVRQVGARSLRTLPGFDAFDFDPLGPEGERIERASEIIPLWFERQGQDLAGLPPEVLIEPVQGLNRDAITDLLRRRDNRPVMLSE
ncbi:MAG: C cytochrome precursor [Myxococcales bacterium]|nr:C cytochrome precursor [Myxococcales bacterium]